MRRFLISLAMAVLSTPVWAEDPVKPATVKPDTAPEDIAAKAMEAMDHLDEGGKKTGKNNKSSKTSADSKSGAEDDSEPDSSTSLLPSGAAASGRGMDMMSRSRLDMMVPVGRSHRGVHYPMYRPITTDRNVIDPIQGGIAGVTAPMDSLFESDLVTRLDSDHVQFDRAKWVQYDDKPAADGQGKPTMTLEIERGVYDLKNEILMTNQPVRIETPQLLIEGDTMLHDRASRLTRLTGRVKMTFYNEEPVPAASPAPASPDSAPASPAPDSPAPASASDAPASSPSPIRQP